MDEEIAERIPIVGIDVSSQKRSVSGRPRAPREVLRCNIHVLHAAPQTRLNAFRLPPENVHDKSPAQAGKDGPCILLDLGLCFGGESLGEEGWGRGGAGHGDGLNGEPGQS